MGVEALEASKKLLKWLDMSPILDAEYSEVHLKNVKTVEQTYSVVG
jgi:hypothetical protein